MFRAGDQTNGARPSLFGHPYLEWRHRLTVLAVACVVGTALSTLVAVRTPTVA